MMISFGAYDDDVYEFMQNNKNASALVRMLVRAYMRGENGSPSVSAPAPTPVNTSQVDSETIVTKEPKKAAESTMKVDKSGFDYSKCNKEEAVITRTEDKNRKKIQ